MNFNVETAQGKPHIHYNERTTRMETLNQLTESPQSIKNSLLPMSSRTTL